MCFFWFSIIHMIRHKFQDRIAQPGAIFEWQFLPVLIAGQHASYPFCLSGLYSHGGQQQSSRKYFLASRNRCLARN